MGVEIRILESHESAVLESVRPEVFDNPVDPGLAIEVLDDPRHHLAIAIDGGAVVGMASAVDYVHPDKAVELWINEVGVAAGYRRRGIGRGLVDALFARGRQRGCREAWVVTEGDNAAARALYSGCGGRADECVIYSFDLRVDGTA